jgi:hypothetical protein
MSEEAEMKTPKKSPAEMAETVKKIVQRDLNQFIQMKENKDAGLTELSNQISKKLNLLISLQPGSTQKQKRENANKIKFKFITKSGKPSVQNLHTVKTYMPMFAVMFSGEPEPVEDYGALEVKGEGKEDEDENLDYDPLSEEDDATVIMDKPYFSLRELSALQGDIEDRYRQMTMSELLQTNQYERSEYPIINQLIKAKQKQNRDDYDRFKALDTEYQNDIKSIKGADFRYLAVDDVINPKDYRNDRNRQFTYLQTQMSPLQIQRERQTYASETRAPRVAIRQRADTKPIAAKLIQSTEKEIASKYKNPNVIYGQQKNSVADVYGSKPTQIYNPFDRSPILNDDDIFKLIS